MEGRETIQEGYLAYLADESRLQGKAPKRIYFPRTTAETAVAVREVSARNERLTVTGARTGIVGGAVPIEAENLLSTLDLKIEPGLSSSRRYGCRFLHVGAGITLEELQHFLQKRQSDTDKPPLSYPVDPTERSCSLGGNVATNASGARTLHFGPTRSWILGLTLVLPDESILRLSRGEVTSLANRFILEGRDGKEAEIVIPRITMPETKHVAGFYLREDMDLLDLFVGSEGTLGIVTEMDLRLLEASGETLYLCIFLPEEKVIPLVGRLKKSASLDPLAIEYMDRRSLELLASYREEQGEASGVPGFPQGTEAVLYTELGGDLDLLYDHLMELLEEMAIDPDSTWSGSSLKDAEAMKAFRHALPERINSIIAARKGKIPALTKIGTDMAVPDHALSPMMDTYRRRLDSAGLQYCIFGHIGNGHLHVNILPRDSREMALGKKLYAEFARTVVAHGGSIAGEHGIGRLKRELLRIQYSDAEIEQMRKIKRVIDPKGLLNPGVLF